MLNFTPKKLQNILLVQSVVLGLEVVAQWQKSQLSTLMSRVRLLPLEQGVRKWQNFIIPQQPSLRTGKSYIGGRLSTIDLLVLTSLDQLGFILKILFSFLTKQATLMRSLSVLSLPPQLVFPASDLLQIIRKSYIKLSGWCTLA